MSVLKPAGDMMIWNVGFETCWRYDDFLLIHLFFSKTILL